MSLGCEQTRHPRLTAGGNGEISLPHVTLIHPAHPSTRLSLQTSDRTKLRARNQSRSLLKREECFQIRTFPSSSDHQGFFSLTRACGGGRLRCFPKYPMPETKQCVCSPIYGPGQCQRPRVRVEHMQGESHGTVSPCGRHSYIYMAEESLWFIYHGSLLSMPSVSSSLDRSITGMVCLWTTYSLR